jgi:signal recognition particle subunit SRP54
VTGKPLKFIWTGEKIDAIEEFHPERMASRILGMGDVVSLVEKAQEQITAEEAAKLQEKMAKGKMTMDDFLGQLRSIRKMGSMKALLGMLPGIGSQLKNLDLDDSQLTRTEAIIQSMTPQEKGDVDLLDNSRRKRVARGSGTQAQDVSQLVRGFEQVSSMTKQMAGMSGMQRLRALGSLGKADMSAMGTRGGPRMKVRQRSKRKKKDRKRRSR